MAGFPLESLDRGLAGAEKALNVLGWVPFVSSVSGAVRMSAGKVMVVAFAVLSALTYIMAYMSNNQKLMDKADQFTQYIWHGFANVGRGFVESIPFLGNVCTILYDSEPAARMCYPNEPLSSRMIPLKITVAA